MHVLPPGSAWIFQNGSIETKGSYFRPQEWEDQEPCDLESYYRELREVFSRTLPRYFDGREQIGMSLTGGLDTRMIMAWHKASPGTLPCYSFGGMFRDCQDVVIARKVAKACGQQHEVIEVGEDFLGRFAHYAERSVYLSDGCTAVNRAADLYANERVREIAPVRMTGNYGGEVLRRVRAFKPVKPSPGLFSPEFLSHIEAAGTTYDGLLHGHPLSFAVFRQAPWHHYGLLALEETQIALRSPYLDNEFVRMVFRAPQSALTNNDISLRLIADGDRALGQIPTDRGIAGNRHGLSASVIQAYIEFTVKAEYAYDYGMPQWVCQIDHQLSPLHLERLFLGKHKFAHYRVWYRDALAKYVREILLDPRTLQRSYLVPSGVETMVEGHLKGGRNYTSEIHQLLTLELVHRLFLDQK
jgi:asparagine synthase (glutamine-hydrolysing)